VGSEELRSTPDYTTILFFDRVLCRKGQNLSQELLLANLGTSNGELAAVIPFKMAKRVGYATNVRCAICSTCFDAGHHYARI
jgi:hypothetical protein